MNPRNASKPVYVLITAMVCALSTTGLLAAPLELGPEQIVQAAGAGITVTGYSVPSYADWNNDNLPDLIVGEGGNGFTPKVRVYLNTGSRSSPVFGSYSLAKSNGSDLTAPTSGCLGIFPRTVQWNGDGRKDLLVGQTDGLVKLYLNNGTDAAPTFDGGTFLQAGAPGAKTNINVSGRATPNVVDWNNDNLKDLIVGSVNGTIYVYINQGTDAAPDFRAPTLLMAGSTSMFAPTYRASPTIADFDGDGKKDILTGDTNGQLLFYSNTGTDASPTFSSYSLVKADGVTIDLAGTPRSRPFVCDWTGDGILDVLVGAGDGKIHLYQGVPEPTTLGLLAAGLLLFVSRRR